MTDLRRVKGSFRDPSGFVFNEEGIVYRQVNRIFQSQYDCQMGGGPYKVLAK